MKSIAELKNSCRQPWIDLCGNGLLGILTLGILIQCFYLRGQSLRAPYQTSWALDLPLTLGSSGAAIGAHLYQATLPPLSQAELLRLDPQDLWPVDRMAAQAWRPPAATLSDVGLITGGLAPLAMLAAPRIRGDWSRYLLLWWQALSLTDGLTTWSKSLTLRPRPLAYYFATRYPELPADLEAAALTPEARFSFFSGHTSLTAVSTFFLARTFADYYPESQARSWVWAGAALLPALVGFWRVRAGKHHPSDVIAGYLVGASVGWLIPALHRRK